MAIYNIDPERRTLHGHFSRDLAPVLTIKPGDTVQYSTLDAGGVWRSRQVLIGARLNRATKNWIRGMLYAGRSSSRARNRAWCWKYGLTRSCPARSE